MKKISILVTILFLIGCSSGSSERDSLVSTQTGFEARDDINTSDLEGFWVLPCTESSSYPDGYQRAFLDYKSGKISNSGNTVSLGYQNFSDANCITPPVFDSENLIPDLEGQGVTFTAVGLYTNVEGITSKVIEFDSELKGENRLAYYVVDQTIYYVLEQNSEYYFDYSKVLHLVD